ncbi:MAG: hypothetical protein NT132_01795 [Microbacterium sp.]|uniref:hypothetical protein n=1 Tax=Microbacterium sp. TaxID=51671 RepID=UPI002638D603|nr:hypothetical protein [Microbacterium sp.]MCX6501140.1 hypothetical protein [Microbacterium sp.]
MPGTIEPLRDGPKAKVPEVRNAYRFLNGTHGSVAGIVSASQRLSDIRRVANKTTVGRLASEEVDLLRSAIVMTSSGIDASMQRIIWDAGRYLIPIGGTAARAQYEAELKQALSGKDKVDEDLKRAIIGAEPAEHLLVYYLRMKTKASFQGSGDLKKRVRNALGVPNSTVPDATLESLDPFFKARNNIAHSMDYERPDESGRRARVHRSVDDVTSMCNNALGIAADLLHAVSDVIVANRPVR